MATWAETYELLVYNIEATYTDRYAGAYHIKQAMLTIINLVSTDEFGVEAATKLFPKIEMFYRFILHYKDIDDDRRLLIYQINKFTETHAGDLTTFVNSVSWINGCIPYYWAIESEQSLYDTSNWIVCS